MNGFHPLHSNTTNEYTLANLDLLDDDFDVDSGVESTVKVAGSGRNGSLKNKERRLNGRRSQEGRAGESRGQEEEAVDGGRTVGEGEEEVESDLGTSQDQPQEFSKGLNERHETLPHHQSSEESKNSDPPPPLSPTSSSEMVS